MSNAIGAARALLARSYFGVQNAMISAREALRIALREGDGALADLARARLRAAHREDLIAEVDSTPPCGDVAAPPLVRVELQMDGAWKIDGEAVALPNAIEHFGRLCRALKFNGAWARENLDLHVSAVRIVDDHHCYAYWNAASGATTLTGALHESAVS